MTLGGRQLMTGLLLKVNLRRLSWHIRFTNSRVWRLEEAFFPMGISISTLKWPELAITGAIFHVFKVFARENIFVAGNGSQNIANAWPLRSWT